MKTILAYRFSAMGDVAMTVPVISEFLEQNPGHRIVMVSRGQFKDLFDGIPNLVFKSINLDDYSGATGMIQLSKDLTKEYKPNYIADLHDVIRSKILNLIYRNSGYNVFKIDKGKKEKKELTNIQNLEKLPLKLTTERYADVFRKMGFDLTLSHQFKSKSNNKKGVGFAPFAQHEGKMLPLDKTFEVIKHVSKNHPIYLFGGGKKETSILNEWAKRLPNTISCAGKFTLKEELQYIANLDVMVSMDSANMHLASLAGTRCISIWGSTHPYAGFLGYGQKSEDIVQIKDLSCRPCSVFGDKACYRGDWACLNEIRVQSIIEKITTAVGEKN